MDLELIRGRVRDSGLTYEQVAAGAVVSHSWLDKFMQGKIEEPGIGKITRLCAFLDAESPGAAAAKAA